MVKFYFLSLSLTLEQFYPVRREKRGKKAMKKWSRKLGRDAGKRATVRGLCLWPNVIQSITVNYQEKYFANRRDGYKVLGSVQSSS